MQRAAYRQSLITNLTLRQCAVGDGCVQRPIHVRRNETIPAQLFLCTHNQRVLRMVEFQYKHGFGHTADAESFALANGVTRQSLVRSPSASLTVYNGTRTHGLSRPIAQKAPVIIIG